MSLYNSSYAILTDGHVCSLPKTKAKSNFEKVGLNTLFMPVDLAASEFIHPL